MSLLCGSVGFWLLLHITWPQEQFKGEAGGKGAERIPMVPAARTAALIKHPCGCCNLQNSEKLPHFTDLIKSNWNHPCLLHGSWTERNRTRVWSLTSTCWFFTHCLCTAVISSTLGKSGAGIDISSSPAVIKSVSMNTNRKTWQPNGCFWVCLYLLSQEPSLIPCKTVYLIQIKPWDKFLVFPLHAHGNDLAALHSSSKDMIHRYEKWQELT